MLNDFLIKCHILRIGERRFSCLNLEYAQKYIHGWFESLLFQGKILFYFWIFFIIRKNPSNPEKLNTYDARSNIKASKYFNPLSPVVIYVPGYSQHYNKSAKVLPPSEYIFFWDHMIRSIFCNFIPNESLIFQNYYQKRILICWS